MWLLCGHYIHHHYFIKFSLLSLCGHYNSSSSSFHTFFFFVAIIFIIIIIIPHIFFLCGHYNSSSLLFHKFLSSSFGLRVCVIQNKNKKHKNINYIISVVNRFAVETFLLRKRTHLSKDWLHLYRYIRATVSQFVYSGNRLPNITVA